MNKAVLLLLATTVIASIVCMHLVRELQAEKARGDALQTRIAKLESTAAQPSVRPTPFSAAVPEPAPVALAAQELQTAPSSLPAPADRPRNLGAMPAGRADQIRRHFSKQREMLQDPEYREAMRVQHRLGLESTYPNLASELGLSQQAADQLLDLLAEHQIRGMQDHEALFLSGEQPDEAAVHEAQQRAQQRQRQQQMELETLLGFNTYQKWQEYQQTLGQRHRVASIQSTLAMAGAPLSSQQSDALLSALVDEQRKQHPNRVTQGTTAVGALAFDGTIPSASMSSGLNALEEQLKTRERSQERLLTSLQSTLTAQQIEHLQNVFKREIEMQRAHMKMQRAQRDGQSNIIGSSAISFSGVSAGFVEFSPSSAMPIPEGAVQE